MLDLAPVDQALSLSFCVQLVHVDDGVVWGPVVYPVGVTAAQGTGALESMSAAGRGYERGCREAAGRLLDDLAEVRR